MRRVVKGGAIAIDGGKIIDIGATDKIAKKYSGNKTIDAKGFAILPGLINTHTHLHQTLLKSLGDDYTLLGWLSEMMFPLTKDLKPKEAYYAALVGCIELIRSGCTCTADNHQNWKTHESCLEAMLDVGIRGIEARGHYVIDRWKALPRELIEDVEESIKRNEELIRKWHGEGNGRLRVWLGMQWPPACSDELFEKAYELSKKYSVGIMMHLHEVKEEVVRWKEETGYTPIQYYFHKGLRILNPNLLAVHCVWLDDEDIRILANRDVKVSHNALSNMYLASGIAPVPKLIKAGVTVSLGVDGAASNNNQDMFELMKTTALLHKVASCDPLAITAEKVLEMATINGAKALGLESEIGSIEVGKKADIILIDLKEANMAPLNRLVSQLVYCGKSYNVHTVIIDGKVVMENRKIKTVDEGEVIEKAQKVTDELVERSKRMDMRERGWVSLPK
ncbi:MAG: amidohydrolase [Halobacteria archaeon]